MTRVLIAAFLLAFAPAAALAQDGSQQLGPQALDKKPRFHGWQGPKPQVKCTCRYKEGRAELGDTVCILKGDHLVTAQCQMMLNNPNWQVLRQGCDTPTS